MARQGFLEALSARTLVLDGAMGTEIQRLGPSAGDFPGGQDGFNDGLVQSRPEWIRQIHRSYLEAGADCVETDTFGSNRIKLDEYGMGDQTVAQNRAAAELAAAEAAAAPPPARYVVGTMGPTGHLPSSSDPDLGRMPLGEIREAFALQAEGLAAGGADALLIETSQDILEVKMAILGAREGMARAGRDVPLIANVTLDRYGKMLLGTGVQAAYTTVRGMGIDAFGLNCSTGPAEMEPSVRWLDENSEHPVLVAPNAGMPENADGQAVYRMGPDEMAGLVSSFLDRYARVRIVGGCCGTRPEHVARLRDAVDARAGRGAGDR